MLKRSKLSTEEKLKVVERYLNGESPTKLASEFKLNDETIRLWTKKYKTFEISGLEEKISWTKYPKELKVSAVEDYLNGVGSLINICNKYGIRDHSTFRDWILKYNTSEELKSYPKGSSKSMKKGRKTTHRERIEIAVDCQVKLGSFQS